MLDMDLKQNITEFIRNMVRTSSQQEFYQEALVGFAAADDPLYNTLVDAMGRKMLTPRDIMPEAQTVVTYFIPYSEKILKAVQAGGKINQTWSDAYSLTNPLLSDIAEQLKLFLEEQNIHCELEPPTMNYDPVNLTAKWSHKSSAVISGIATFGLNRLIITKYGTMGRLNTIFIDQKIEPDKRLDTEYCLYKKNGSCGICMKRCPAGAIKPYGFDRFRCNAYLDGKNISDYEQGCSMCSTGPCALKGFE